MSTSSESHLPDLSTTIVAWARAYVESTDLSHKIDPPSAPNVLGDRPAPVDLRPGRPAEIEVSDRAARTFKQGALVRPEARAALHHKFWHHELQAAELMCWAILRFPDTPRSFVDGLIRIHRDEVRHMKMYQKHIEVLGFELGSFPVRDWFWERVPTCETALQFVALLGMGLEGANLDHTARFSAWLRAVGDHEGAELQEQVGREEVAHVRFANRWFREWAGDLSFEKWKNELPAPLTPLLMRGKTLQRTARLRAEFPASFLDALDAWHPDESPIER